MNEQQWDLISILNTARDDLLAGRPAQGVAAGLKNYFACAMFTDLDEGADDTSWRPRRGVRRSAIHPSSGADTTGTTAT